MRRVVVFLATCACLFGADFWESKPLRDWSDKDVQKLATNSPWAKSAKGIAEGARSSTPASNQQDFPQPGIGHTPAEGLGAGPSSPGEPPSPFDSAARAAAVTPEINVTVRWLTSYPMRQAQMRAKYGKEADTSPAAKQYLETEPAYYTLGIASVPGLLLSAFGGDRAQQLVQQTATLTPKGKDPIRAAAVQFVPNGANVDVLVAFPRMTAITLNDQEVEFAGRLGSLNVRTKFRLKDMQVRGKLEL